MARAEPIIIPPLIPENILIAMNNGRLISPVAHHANRLLTKNMPADTLTSFLTSIFVMKTATYIGKSLGQYFRRDNDAGKTFGFLKNIENPANHQRNRDKDGYTYGIGHQYSQYLFFIEFSHVGWPHQSQCVA